MSTYKEKALSVLKAGACRRLYFAVLALVYPPRCPVCGALVHRHKDLAAGFIHPQCREKLTYVRGPVCLKCGKPVYSPVQELCLDCSRKTPAFDGGASVWVYTKPMAYSIAMYKYHHRREYCDFYVQEVVKQLSSWILQRQVDCITAVPLHKKKAQSRGFNQAWLLAKEIGRRLGILADDQLLVRTRYTEPQRELGAAQRFRNLEKAFERGHHAGKYSHVLLVDDIYTTGSTMRICSNILKEAGAVKVWILSLCIGSDY